MGLELEYYHKADLLSKLLAVVYEDGGHYELNYGIDKAVEDAIVIFHELREIIEEKERIR